MMWDVLFGPVAAFYIDFIVFVLAVVNTLIVALKFRVLLMERWDSMLILLEKGKTARIYRPRIVAGRFIDLGRHGEIQVNPEAVYRVVSPFKSNLVVAYSGCGVNVPIHLLGEAELARLRGEGKLVEVAVEELNRYVRESFNPIQLATLMDYGKIAYRAMLGEVREGMFKYLLVYAIVIVVGFIAIALLR